MDDVDHDAGMVSINKTWDYKNDSGSCYKNKKTVLEKYRLNDDFIKFVDHLPPTKDGRLLPPYQIMA